MKKENERLKEQVEAEARSRTDNSAVQSHILKLADHADSYKKKIEVEQRRLEELDKQQREWEESERQRQKEEEEDHLRLVQAGEEKEQQLRTQKMELEEEVWWSRLLALALPPYHSLPLIGASQGVY